jgi:hypothetical protein
MHVGIIGDPITEKYMRLHQRASDSLQELESISKKLKKNNIHQGKKERLLFRQRDIEKRLLPAINQEISLISLRAS